MRRERPGSASPDDSHPRCGAFLAIERADRDVIALLKVELLAKRVARTHGGVIAQVWRGGAGKPAGVARLLAATEIVALDDRLGRRAGVLLGRARGKFALDAAVVMLAMDGDTILTSDAGGLRPLTKAEAVHVDIVPV